MKTAYFGNPWLGMFMKTNDRHTFIPLDSMKKLEDAVAQELKTEVTKIGIADSNLLGVYLAMNSAGIILPNITGESEIALVKKAGLNVYVSKDRHNANGNNIAVNDKGGLINPNVEKAEAKMMEDALGVELVPMTVAGYSTVGSAVLATNGGFLAHFKASPEEMERLKEVLHAYGNRGTVNTGTGFVAYGALVNRSGYLIGEGTSAFEVGRMEEALGLIK